jgi:hypothetical protein
MTTLIAVPAHDRSVDVVPLAREIGRDAEPAAVPAVTNRNRALERERERLADYRLRAQGFVPRREQLVDATLADSFPASDPPSWTLGVSAANRAASIPEGVIDISRARAGSPGWLRGAAALVGGGLAAIGFMTGVLVGGAVLALAVRLFVRGVVAALGWMMSAPPG